MADESKTAKGRDEAKAAGIEAQAEVVEEGLPKDPAALDAPNGPAFGRAFWMCNSIEMFERLAYFGIRSVVPIYIMQATEPGGLHLTAVHKGVIYAWWAIVQSWLPMFTGGIADRYGYKRVLALAISANAIGYVMMAMMPTYFGFFAGILVLAAGTAFFKPALQGSIAQNLTKATSSMGWGIFYWVVNIGAFGAPILATIILGQPHSAEGWRNLFLASAIYTCMNLLLLFTFKDVPSGADKNVGLNIVFWRTVENIWPYWFQGGRVSPPRMVAGIVLIVAGVGLLTAAPITWIADYQSWLGTGVLLAGVFLFVWQKGGRFTWQLRLPAFILIMSCFWLMMYQLWDLHPNFIEDWIDSSAIAEKVPFSSWQEYGDRGIIRVPQQILLNLNAFLIIALIVPVSWLVRHMRTLSAMLIGMTVATGGVLLAGLTGNGWVLLLGVVFFSLGEMLTGPKKNEYLALIAPPGKKGLYLGYVNIPVGLGVGIGSLIAGFVYNEYGEKATLALKHMAEHPKLIAPGARSVDWSDSLDLVPELLEIDRADAFDVAQQDLGLPRDAAAAQLVRMFRHDRGQVTNLALFWLQRNPVEGQGEINRGEAYEIVRDRLTRMHESEKPIESAAVKRELWDAFAEDPEVLNALALEYLAQGTDRLESAVARIDFTVPPSDVKLEDDSPIGIARARMKEDVGIGRTKAFAALTAALGADAAAVEAALELSAPTVAEHDRPYVYLMNQRHHRFMAVARKDWKTDVTLLKELLDSQPDVRAFAESEIDNVSAMWKVKNSLWSIFGMGEDTGADLSERLAGRPELVQRSLDVMDWSKSPEHAARLLGINPFEARAAVSREVNGSPVEVTQILWDRHHPQYMVWVPFATIGFIAAIALAIFGRMAKRWADMNA